jgi:hypothetical protein
MGPKSSSGVEKLGEEPLEVGPAERLRERPHERALRGSRRAQQQDVIAAEQGIERSLDDLTALGELGSEILSELLELLNRCGHRDSLWVGRQARRS